ncbi:MAG TPA: exosome complex protein Rrp4 [Candidatus Lokiarchaeia archaeon]|nr:exosome complex protein Rrp4 [Candidatus Lokiarchaeia archaeon]
MAEFYEDDDNPSEEPLDENLEPEETEVTTPEMEDVLAGEESPSAAPEETFDTEESREEIEEEEEGQEEMEETMPREIVVPGQVLGQKSKDLLSGYGTVTAPSGIISLYVGFLQQRGKYLNVIPFKGRYIPHVGDKVIGKIFDKNVVLWKIDINSPYISILRPSDAGDSDRGNRRPERGGRGGGQEVRRRFDRGGKKEDTSAMNVGDIIIAKVLRFDRTTEPALTTVGPDLGLIRGGFLIDITVPKIPRLIGKSGSMIKLLNSLTTCKIFVAQNGVVWVKGRKPEDERIIIKAIRKIESEAHTVGLTDRVKEFIDNELKNLNN